MRVHYRRYAYPKPVPMAVVKCGGVYDWRWTTKDFELITCKKCERVQKKLFQGGKSWVSQSR